MAMKNVRVLLLVLVAGVCVGAGAWIGARSARGANEALDQPPVPAPVGRYQVLPQGKDASADDLQIIDTATGRLYGLHRREKVKDKEAFYEWYLLADAPK
jgi:hypothetical protein